MQQYDHTMRLFLNINPLNFFYFLKEKIEDIQSFQRKTESKNKYNTVLGYLRLKLFVI